MDIQLKKGAIDLVILKFLSRKDMYGYEINKMINEILEINESTVYVILKKLINAQFCQTYLSESLDGPPRKYYRLSASGEKHLQKLVAEWKLFIIKINTLIED